MSFDFFPNEQSAAILHAARNPSTTPDPGTFDNFLEGAGQYTMRSLAEVGRAASMAGAVVPIAIDAVAGDDNYSGKSLTDRYFETHDEIFGRAVEHWTPKPGEVGTAGQVVGQLAGGIMQAIVSPALLVGTTQLSSAEGLVRQGVDAKTANTVGAIQGAAMAVGVSIPAVGQSLATRIASGAGGNLAQGTAAALASSEVLKAGGYEKPAEQYNPWELRARLLDVMLGAAFGGLAHLKAGTKDGGDAPPKLTPTDEAALLVANQARHLEDATSNGRPLTDADATMHAAAMREAIEQVLRGEPVSVDAITRDMRLVPDDSQMRERIEVADEALRLAQEHAPIGDPIFLKNEPTPAPDLPLEHAPESLTARRVAQERPDLMIPTQRFDVDGAPVSIRAAEMVALADAEVAHAQQTSPGIFRAAAHCLLGAL